MTPHISGYKHDGPFDSDFLAVDTIHQIHYEQYGRENGKPGRVLAFSHHHH